MDIDLECLREYLDIKIAHLKNGNIHCICQHRHIKLFNRILSFQRSRIPLKLFHFGEVNFCLKYK